MIGVKRETLSLDEIQNNSVILKSGNGWVSTFRLHLELRQ